jgi:hypothetical protein
MSDTPARLRLRRQLEAHLTQLGYSSVRPPRPGRVEPEIVRISPVRGSIVYGETVLRADLRNRRCHERLLSFSQRRTRHRSSILFFIGVQAEDQKDLETLLEELEIRSGMHGGHVHIVPIAAAEPARRRPTTRAQKCA